MNKAVLMGRITKDLELKKAGETSVVKFNLAVNRRFTKNAEDKQADFISCVAFGKTADVMAQHLGKGRQIVLEGRIQTGSYEKDGNKVYTTDVIVEAFSFADSKREETGANSVNAEEDDLPF